MLFHGWYFTQNKKTNTIWESSDQQCPQSLSSLHRWHLEQNQKGWSSNTYVEFRMHFPKEMMLQTVALFRWTRMVVQPCHSRLSGKQQNDDCWSQVSGTWELIILFSLPMCTLEISYNKMLKNKRWKNHSGVTWHLYHCSYVVQQVFSIQLLLQPIQNLGYLLVSEWQCLHWNISPDKLP